MWICFIRKHTIVSRASAASIVAVIVIKGSVIASSRCSRYFLPYAGSGLSMFSMCVSVFMIMRFGMSIGGRVRCRGG